MHKKARFELLLPYSRWDFFFLFVEKWEEESQSGQVYQQGRSLLDDQGVGLRTLRHIGLAEY